ncbi:MAG: hypothetical protein RBT62_03920 [Spirochaetia bacterium]|jgi:hypothetical protein|nr:hypothetical protein [Spirochaetia bacterium]
MSPVRWLALAASLVCSGMPGLCGLPALGAQAYGDEASLVSLEFKPASFLPGDVVTIYARLEPGDVEWSEATRSDGFPDTGAMGPQVLSVSIEKRSGEPLLILRFVPWKAGPSYIPELSIAGLRIPRIRFDCETALVPGEAKPLQAMAQMEYPGIYSRLYIVGGALIVACLLGVTMLARIGPYMRELRARLALARSRRVFDETLRRLAERGRGASVGADSDAAAWAELCSAVRQFTGLRSGTDWGALTSSEVEALPDDAAPGGVRPDLARLFAAGDAVRFAGDRKPSLKDALVLAASIADRLDASKKQKDRPKDAGADESARSAS